MVRRIFVPDMVAVTGGVVGLLSLSFGWLTQKPNRLASGTALYLWDASGWKIAAILLGLWLCCLFLSLFGKKQWHTILLGITLNIIFILTFMVAGITATRLINGGTAFTRISLGAGIWTTCLGAYISIFSCRQRLGGSVLWQNLISWSGLLIVAFLLGIGWLNNISIISEFINQEMRFRQELVNHVIIFLGSVVIGTIIGIPLGIWASRSRYAEKPIFFITNILETVPSLALFGLLIAPLSALSLAFPVLRQSGISGIGPAPAIIALTLYSLLPIAQNTYVGLTHLDPGMLDAGRGMGMGRSKLFWRIEIPLSAPLVLEGVRTASVQAVGNTAIAALIGAGGLGWFIFQGIAQAADDVVLLGAIPIITLALVVDAIMRLIVRISTPKGLRAK